MLKLRIIISVLVLLSVFNLQSQTNLKIACNGDVLKETDAHLGKLSKLQMKRFLLTFEDSCEINAEYSEWSNELLFHSILKQPKLFLSIMSENSKINKHKIYTELESPINDGINLDSTVIALKTVKSFSAQRDSILKRITIAISKYKTQ